MRINNNHWGFHDRDLLNLISPNPDTFFNYELFNFINLNVSFVNLKLDSLILDFLLCTLLFKLFQPTFYSKNNFKNYEDLIYDNYAYSIKAILNYFNLWEKDELLPIFYLFDKNNITFYNKMFDRFILNLDSPPLFYKCLRYRFLIEIHNDYALSDSDFKKLIYLKRIDNRNLISKHNILNYLQLRFLNRMSGSKELTNSRKTWVTPD